MYPRLPSATMADSMAAGYPTASSTAPPSTLGGIFDHDDRRRYTGGTLQRARPETRQLSEEMDLTQDSKDEGERTPKAKEHSSPSSPERISASLIDPALSGTAAEAEATLRTAQAATEVAERADVQWVEKVRLIEYLRNYIASRLERGEFENQEAGGGNSSSSSNSSTHEQTPEANPDTHMEGVETEAPSKAEEPAVKPETGDVVMYPTLRGVDEDGDSKMP